MCMFRAEPGERLGLLHDGHLNERVQHTELGPHTQRREADIICQVIPQGMLVEFHKHLIVWS